MDKGETVMRTKKDLLKRIRDLEKRTEVMDSSATSELKIRKEVLKQTEFMRETISIYGAVLQKYREVLLTSGVITPCDASRTEFQWQEGPDDKLGRNFHFKVNQVITKKEKQ